MGREVSPSHSTVWVTPEGRPEVDRPSQELHLSNRYGQGQAADGEAKSASLLGGVHTWLLFLATLIVYQKSGDLSSFN